MFDQLLCQYPVLAPLKDKLNSALGMLYTCFSSGNKIMVCGNGGSAADSEHIVAELMKSFMLPRKLTASQQHQLREAFPEQDQGMKLVHNLQRAIPAISLVSGVALPSAFANDVDAEYVFAQQVFALGRKGDVLWAISTSGNSRNIIYAMQVARAFGIYTLGLTGRDGGAMASLCDVELRIPFDSTPRIQEMHLPVYHALCMELEKKCFA